MMKFKQLLKKVDGIISLILGVVILINPFSTFGVLMIITGSIITIQGFARIWSKLQAERNLTVNNVLLPVIGISLVLTNDESRYIVGWVLGISLIYNGIKTIMKASEARSQFKNSMIWSGVVLIALGLFLGLVPGVLVFTLSILLGLLFIAYGIIRLWILPMIVSKFKNLNTYKSTSSGESFKFGSFDFSQFASHFNDDNIIDVDDDE